MLGYATSQSKKDEIKLLNDCNNINDLITFYTINSDEFFLKETIKNRVSKTNIESAVLEELIERKLFKRVFQHKIILVEKPFEPLEIKIKKIKNLINEKLTTLESENIFSVADLFENKTFKDSNDKSILIARKNGKEYMFSCDWANGTREFEMADMNVIMIRIYIRRTFKSSDEFEISKEKVLNIVNIEIEQLKSISLTI